MLRPVQFLFTIFLLSNASSFLRLTHEEYDHWISRCGYGDVERKYNVGWFVVVHNRVTQRYDGGAVISPKHVLTARASVGTSDGVPSMPSFLDVFVFNTTDMTGIDFTKKGSPYFLQLTEKFTVQHVVIPTISETKNIYNFAVLEIENEFRNKVGKVCLNMLPAKSIAAKSPLDVVYLASTTTHAYQKKSIEFGIHDQNCYELHCEDLLRSGNTKKGEPGDPWFRTINGRDQLLGMGLGDGVATSISYWSDFLCMLIGACVSGYEEESPMKHSDFPYFFDGVFRPYFKEPMCSNEHRLQLIRQSTPFTRLTKTEQRSLKTECGQTLGSEHPATGSLELVNSFLVTILSEKMECHMHGIMQDCDLEDQRKMFKCAGVLISPLHVISSASCLKIALEETGSTLDAIFTDHVEYENEKFPFQEDDLFPIRYHPSKVGKRWIRVAKVVVPYVDIEERKNDLDIALVQLEQRIPLESYIKPICIKQEVLWSPSFRVVRQDEIPFESPAFGVIRKIFVDKIIESKSPCPEEQKDECHLIEFYTNNSITIEHRGSPIFEYAYSEELDASKRLVGILIDQAKEGPPYLTKAHRVQYFSTFICIHTGVCRDGEEFEKRLFVASFIEKDLSIQNGLIERGISKANAASSISWQSHEKEMDAIVDALMKEVPVHFTAEQNNDIQAECGKKPASNRMYYGIEYEVSEWPWAVYLGNDDPDHKSGISAFCTGVLISRRHIMTARHCFIGEEWPVRQKITVMYGGVRWNSAPETFKKVGIRRKIYPSFSGEFYDLAVGELEHDIEGNVMGFVCLPRKIDYGNADTKENFERTAFFFGGGRGENKPRGQFFLTYRHKSGHAFAGPGDSGGPLIRKRISDGRYTLIALLHGATSSCPACTDGWDIFTGIQDFLDDICKVTGICADELDESRLGDIDIDGSRVCV